MVLSHDLLFTGSITHGRVLNLESFGLLVCSPSWPGCAHSISQYLESELYGIAG